MQKQKKATIGRKDLFFSLLFTPTPKYHKRRLLVWGFIFLFSLFIIFNRINITSGQETVSNCTTSYGDWSTCSPNGMQERLKTLSCTGAATYTSTERQTCTYTQTPLPCTDYTYSAWSTTCQNGIYTRAIVTRAPYGCLETITGSRSPETQKACDTTAGSCQFTYSAWGDCRSDGTQTRTMLTQYPTGCSGGTQIIKQNCTYSQTVPECSFAYSAWGNCQSTGTQTRTVTSTSPTGCTGGNPETSRNCTYVPGAPNNSSTIPYSGVTPEFKFIYPNNDSVLRDKIVIKGSVPDAKTVEFYLTLVGSNSPVYVGAGAALENGNWEYVFDANQSPNGYYDLSAKIANAYGNYTSGNKIRVKIERLKQTDQATSLQAPSVGTSQANSALPENYNNSTPPDWQEKYFRSRTCLDKDYCGGEADPDRDGLNNNDEFRYRTDPLNPDTDSDGFLDGDEVKNGFNPLQFSPGDRSDKIVFESPKEVGEIKKDIYQINSVELVTPTAETGKKELHLSGKGLPNSFVTIYIYSDLPVILTVKTDSDGNWSYVLDKQIEDGEHQIYVAVTDNTGKITAKSEPLFFVKTAEAATIIPSAEASALAKSVAPAEKRRTRDLMVVAGIIILGFIFALTAIGFYIIHTNKKSSGLA